MNQADQKKVWESIGSLAQDVQDLLKLRDHDAAEIATLKQRLAQAETRISHLGG